MCDKKGMILMEALLLLLITTIMITILSALSNVYISIHSYDDFQDEEVMEIYAEP